MKENILKDGLHWIGWIFSAIMIFVSLLIIFHYTNILSLLTTSELIMIFFSIFTTEVIIDWIKHYIKLQ